MQHRSGALAEAEPSVCFVLVLGPAYWRLAYVYEYPIRVHVRKYAQKLAKEALP